MKNILPSIDDFSDKIHKPSIMSFMFWRYGYINAFNRPIARKHRITGKVQYRRYNETFKYWCYMDVNNKYKSEFIAYKKLNILHLLKDWS